MPLETLEPVVKHWEETTLSVTVGTDCLDDLDTLLWVAFDEDFLVLGLEALLCLEEAFLVDGLDALLYEGCFELLLDFVDDLIVEAGLLGF